MADARISVDIDIPYRCKGRLYCSLRIKVDELCSRKFHTSNLSVRQRDWIRRVFVHIFSKLLSLFLLIGQAFFLGSEHFLSFIWGLACLISRVASHRYTILS